jgi:putative ABC transport system substrate-binding protein
MKRRHALCIGAPLLAWPALALAQARKYRVGFLGTGQRDESAERNLVGPFRQALLALGYTEGRNLEIHYRWAEGKPDRLPGLVAELLKLDPDVLVTVANRPALVAKSATSTVPVVAVAVDNPVELGLVSSFARPGGNVTGISSFGAELVAKRLQLMKELVPSVRKVAVLSNPVAVPRAAFEPVRVNLERSLGLPILFVEARGPEDFDAAFETIRHERADGLLVFQDAVFWLARARLHELVAKHRLPSIWGARDYLEGGGLASYQSDFAALFRRAAAMVDLILKGAKPAEIPFEQATKLELVISVKAANALGISVPQSLLVSADEVIR